MDFSSEFSEEFGSEPNIDFDFDLAVKFAMLVEREEHADHTHRALLDDLTSLPISQFEIVCETAAQTASQSWTLGVEATRDETNPRSLVVDRLQLGTDAPDIDPYVNVSGSILLNSPEIFDDLVARTTAPERRDAIRVGVAKSLVDSGGIEHAFSVADAIESDVARADAYAQVVMDVIARFQPDTALSVAMMVEDMPLSRHLLALTKTVNYAVKNPAALDDAIVMLGDNPYVGHYPTLVASAYVRESGMNVGCYAAREAVSDIGEPTQRVEAMRTLAEITGSIGTDDDRRFMLTEIASNIQPGERYRLAAAYAVGCGVLSQRAALEQLRLVFPTPGGYDATEWLHAFYAKGALRTANECLTSIAILNSHTSPEN